MNDLISREAAIGYALNGRVREGVNGEMWIRVKDVKDSLLDVPSAEKHGKWILITNNYIDPQNYMCSVCGRIIKYYGIPELLLKNYPYCNCGARMGRSEDERTD